MWRSGFALVSNSPIVHVTSNTTNTQKTKILVLRNKHVFVNNGVWINRLHELQGWADRWAFSSSIQRINTLNVGDSF